MAKYGLVLSSDGSKSSFEIGAWKALRELDVMLSAVSGSFVGALNAALIAQGDFERAVRFWRNVSSKNLFDVSRFIAQKYTEEWSKADTKVFKKSFLKYIQGKSAELDPLREVLENFIDERAVRSSETRLGFVSVSLSTLEAEVLPIEKIPRGKLTQYLLAAACFPQISQVNRVADPQFSARYSPYRIITGYNTTAILSTDDVAVVPPDVDADVTLIHSSEAFELDFCESAETMRRNIKLGYVDTLRLFQESIGKTYFICKSAKEERFAQFQRGISRPLSGHLNDLLKMLLRINAPEKEAIEARLTQMLRAAGAPTQNLHLDMLEHTAKILQVPKDEKYTLDKFILAICSRMNQCLTTGKRELTDPQAVRRVILDVVEPGHSLPGGELFAQYFLLLLSCKPASYHKMQAFVGSLNLKTIVAMVTVLYLLY